MDSIACICREIKNNSNITQRLLSQKLNISLGKINKLLNDCINSNYIEKIKTSYYLTYKGNQYLKNYKVDNAVILAAGFGTRFVPITYDTPKGLVDINGERMIERQIRQLNEMDIYDITIVVGYLKEKFDYLIDKYGVKLIYNPEYKEKNNLTSLYYAKNELKNTYVLVSDNFITENVFNTYEGFSWYSCTFKDGKTSKWCINKNSRSEISQIKIGGENSLILNGPCYFTKTESSILKKYLELYYKNPGTEDLFWENILMDHIDEFHIYANEQPTDNILEISSVEELKTYKIKCENYSNNQILQTISKILNISKDKINNMSCIKAGMTNKSFKFNTNDTDYIFRVPYAGSNQLINRFEEKESYDAVKNMGICEEILYLNPQTGYKLSKYYTNSHCPDAHNLSDVKQCMNMIKKLHNAKIKINHSFNIKEKIIYYEKLCMENNAINYYDYSECREKAFKLLNYLESLNCEKVLSHIDSVVDNFLILPNNTIKLIDWEYSGMSDPLIDISMFAIYSYYSQDELETAMKFYFERDALSDERIRVYSYVALGGFLWSLWAQYKQSQGIEFGEYGMKMYRYFKEYYNKLNIL